MDCCAGAAPALHLRRSRVAASDSGPDRHLPDAHGHFSEYRYSRGQHSVELRRPERPGSLQPDRDLERTHIDHYGGQYRAQRVAIAERNCGSQGIFPAPRQHRKGDRADHRDLPDPVAAAAAGDDAAADHHLQRLHRADSAAGLVGTKTLRATALRLRREFYPHPAGHDSRRRRFRTLTAGSCRKCRWTWTPTRCRRKACRQTT